MNKQQLSKLPSQNNYSYICIFIFDIAENKVINPSKIQLSMPDAEHQESFCMSMPSYIGGDFNIAGFKWASESRFNITQPGRESEDELGVCATLGVGAVDIAIAYKLCQNVLEKGIGQKLMLWDNPLWV